MKKHLIYFLFWLFSNSPLLAQTPSITAISVSQRADGTGLADIHFTLSGTANAYYIAVEASFNGGNTFSPIPSGSLTGDTGPISPGAGKHIIWNGLQSFPNTYSTQAKVKLFVSATPPAGLPCPGTPTVVYGGQTYNTVQIGTQCWLKENLNIGTMINGSSNQTNNGIIEKYCYNNDEDNCAIYGGLYQWNEMMQYVTTPGIKGICPTGWHIPTDGEWCTVTQFLDPTVNCGVQGWSGTNAGGKMKSTGTIQAGTGLWNTPNTGATNESGFTAVPAGSRYSNGTFGGIGYYGVWWSSSEIFTYYAWYRDLGYNASSVYRFNDYKHYGFSVRCLRDFGSSTPIVSTSAISNIGQTTAISGGNVTNDNGSTVASRGVCWNTAQNPTIANSHTSDGSGTGIFTSNIAGLSANTMYYFRAYATNGIGTSYGNELSFTTTTESQGIPCPGMPTITDPRDGRVYNTVQIGTQCWMKENLNVGNMIYGNENQTNNGSVEKYCFYNFEGYCNVYGGLYQWDEMMQYETSQSSQGICPYGWYIPTDGDWTALTAFLGGENVAGGKMKEFGFSHWQNPNTGATNESGFFALPGGQKELYSGYFLGLGQNAFLWSSSEELNYSGNAWILSPDYNSANVNRSSSSKYSGNSVRCLKGEAIPTVSTTSVSNINQTSATSGGNVTHNGGATITARGICWSTSPNPSIANSHTTDGTGIGFFVSSLTGLTPVTLYYVRAYATNTAGTAYGNQVFFTTSSGLPCGSSININHVAGIVAPVTKTVTYGIVMNIPGEPSKCWITSNLGADHQATAVDDATEASAGWYWQFNRKQGYKHDGITRTPNATWITVINENLDWQSANDPCVLELGNGWRIPTKSEWENVDMSGNWSDWTGPWNSGLKLHAAGYLQNTDGSLDTRGSGGQYLNATQINAENSQFLYFSNGDCEFASAYKSNAFSLRCLRD